MVTHPTNTALDLRSTYQSKIYAMSLLLFYTFVLYFILLENTTLSPKSCDFNHNMSLRNL